MDEVETEQVLERAQTYSRQVLYDVEWQLLRVSLLGRWGQPEDVKGALRELSDYCTRAQNDVQCRRWRVMNLLNAVLLSYKGGSVHPCYNTVVAARLRAEYLCDSALEVGEGVWSWTKVAEDLKKPSHSELKELRQNLKQRVRTGMRRSRERGHDMHRPELLQFLDILEWELRRREGDMHA